MKIFAHRGASGQYPENSRLAFEHAIKQDADGIELDVQYHVESGSFVVLHDQYLDTATSGNGDFNQYSILELTALRLGQGQCLLTLDDALASINGKVAVNIEVKTTVTDPTILTNICFALNECISHAMTHYAYAEEHFIISSFNHTFLHFFGTVYPDYSLAALIAHAPYEQCQFTEQLSIQYVNQDIDSLNVELVEDAHARGLKVYVYTVDRFEDIEKCYHAKVDGIFTNYPEKTRKFAQLCIDE
ncbi:glycerophosphodiester phosphodiesterase [Thalassotalea fusca]